MPTTTNSAHIPATVAAPLNTNNRTQTTATATAPQAQSTIVPVITTLTTNTEQHTTIPPSPLLPPLPQRILNTLTRRKVQNPRHYTPPNPTTKHTTKEPTQLRFVKTTIPVRNTPTQITPPTASKIPLPTGLPKPPRTKTSTQTTIPHNYYTRSHKDSPPTTLVSPSTTRNPTQVFHQDQGVARAQPTTYMSEILHFTQNTH